jgi:hypothetical protein
MRTSLYLKVEAQPGCSITNAIKDAIRIADILVVTVEFDFNSVKCLINPHADAAVAEARWNDALSSKRPIKIMSA